MFRSSDHGETWIRVGLSANPITAFPPDSLLTAATSPSDTSLLFVGGTYGLWRTTNAGRTWTLVSPVAETCSISCWQVAAAAYDGRTLFASAIYWDQNQAPPAGFGYVAGVFRSADQGHSWEKVYSPSSPIAPYIAIDPFDSERVYLYAEGPGLLRSADGGTSWEQITPVDYGNSSLAFDASRPRRLYAGGDRWGVFMSEDSGSTWTYISQPLGLNVVFNSDVVSIAVDPRDHRVYALWADIFAGVYRLLVTDDDGAHWAESMTQAGNTKFVQQGQGPQVFVAEDSTVLVSGPDGISVSHDGGISWHPAAFSYGPPRRRAVR